MRCKKYKCCHPDPSLVIITVRQCGQGTTSVATQKLFYFSKRHITQKLEICNQLSFFLAICVNMSDWHFRSKRSPVVNKWWNKWWIFKQKIAPRWVDSNILLFLWKWFDSVVDIHDLNTGTVLVGVNIWQKEIGIKNRWMNRKNLVYWQRFWEYFQANWQWPQLVNLDKKYNSRWRLRVILFNLFMLWLWCWSDTTHNNTTCVWLWPRCVALQSHSCFSSRRIIWQNSLCVVTNA